MSFMNNECEHALQERANVTNDSKTKRRRVRKSKASVLSTELLKIVENLQSEEPAFGNKGELFSYFIWHSEPNHARE